MAQAIGGQAVLEGVMMRGPRNWAVAVRKPDGEIAQVAREIDPLAVRHWALRLPVVRGVVALGESLSIGFRALSVSANYAAVVDTEEERLEGEEPEELSRWALVFSFAVAIGFALMLFKVGPALPRRSAADLERRLVRDRRGPDPRQRVRPVPRMLSSSRRYGASSSTTRPSTR